MHQEPMPEAAPPMQNERREATDKEVPKKMPAQGASREASRIELEAAVHTQEKPRSSMLSAASDVAPEESELGLFLIRPTAASAAKALSSYRVELNSESRFAQIKRLSEFRGDTRELASEATRWMTEYCGAQPVAESIGLISSGIIATLSRADASALRREVKDIQVIENRVLPIISPLRRKVGEQAEGLVAPWHLEAIGQAIARRNGRAFSGRGVHIAILDTGVDINHSELGNRVVDGWSIRPGSPTVDASAIVPDANHYDTDGHGTHVAGLILGTHFGVAPNATASSVVMMPRGYATTFDFIRCLDWAAEDPRFTLVNFSAGESPYNDDMAPLIADLIRVGVLPFIAVGNDGRNTHCSPGDYIQGISVGSVNRSSDGKPENCAVSSFSGSAQMTHNHSVYDVPDVVAPGAGIYSSYINEGYAELDGTSMATPVACGVAACLIEKAGGILSPTELADQILAACIKVQGPKIRQGSGLVQAPERN